MAKRRLEGRRRDFASTVFRRVKRICEAHGLGEVIVEDGEPAVFAARGCLAGAEAGEGSLELVLQISPDLSRDLPACGSPSTAPADGG